MAMPVFVNGTPLEAAQLNTIGTEVDRLGAESVQKVAAPQVLYGTGVGPAFAPTTYGVAQGSFPSSVAQRDSSGRLQVATPTLSTHAATKGYVDATGTWAAFTSGVFVPGAAPVAVPGATIQEARFNQNGKTVTAEIMAVLSTAATTDGSFIFRLPVQPRALPSGVSSRLLGTLYFNWGSFDAVAPAATYVLGSETFASASGFKGSNPAGTIIRLLLNYEAA